MGEHLFARVEAEQAGEGFVAVEENAVESGPVDACQIALEEEAMLLFARSQITTSRLRKAGCARRKKSSTIICRTSSS